MIVVKIELHSAVTRKDTLLREVVIWNNGHGDGMNGQYHAKIKDEGDEFTRDFFAMGYVGPFSHYRPDPVEKLVAKAFQELNLT